MIPVIPSRRGWYVATLDALGVETRPEWQPGYWPVAPFHKPGATWCSRALEAGLAALRVPGPPPGALANAQGAWYDSEASRALGWYECSQVKAVERAEMGNPTVGCLFEEPHGHVFFVVPSLDGSLAMHVWQAGGHNYTNAKVSFALTDRDLAVTRFYTLDAPAVVASDSPGTPAGTHGVTST